METEEMIDRAIELVGYWNKQKRIHHSTRDSSGGPTTLVRVLANMIGKDGDEAVTAWVYKKMEESDVKDMSSILYRGPDYIEFSEAYKAKLAATQTAAAQPMDGNQALSALAGEVVKLMGGQLVGDLEKKVNAIIADKQIVKIVSIDGIPAKPVEGVTHEKFDTILKFVAMDEPVMLVGPAGTGKNVICKQVADALGLDFYLSNAITQEYKLTGFVDAMGNYQETQFYKAFTKGGLFMLDEIDASIPEALVILNCAIANRYFDFPKIGKVQANKNFRVIANANTFGTGASMEYVGRYQLDAASLDRFAVVKIGYDCKIEEAVSEGERDCLEFCRSFRNVALSNGLRVIVSYREISRLHKMVNYAKMPIQEAISDCLVKGLEKDSIRMVASGMPDSISWKKYLIQLL